MKKLQLTIALLLFGFLNVFSQNWQPIQLHKSYNYQLNTADYITNVIKVDSINIIEGDSVFFLNRIMTNCDTCENNANNDFALKNQPQFLMKKMLKKSEALFVFQDTAEFQIMPLLHFGQSWVYNSEHNINAVISYEGIDNILGITDSVKRINLSNGNQIMISKNNGILQFQDKSEIQYNLVGTEGDVEIGEQLPDFWSFHNFEIGDIFQRRSSSEGFGDGYSADFFDKKYTILSKVISENAISYDISGWIKHIEIRDYLYFDTTAVKFEQTIVFTDSSNHFTNKYPNELINIAEYADFEDEGTWLNKVEVYKENGLYVKKAGDFNEFYSHYSESFAGSDLLVGNSGNGADQIELNYIENCGLSINMMYFEGALGDIFIGKVHAGDTIGTVYPDSYFEKYAINNEKLHSNDILTYPNPIHRGQSLHVKTNAEINSYHIYTISGMEILDEDFRGEINTNSLSPGIYILELTTNNGIERKKIIVR